MPCTEPLPDAICALLNIVGIELNA